MFAFRFLTPTQKSTQKSARSVTCWFFVIIDGAHCWKAMETKSIVVVVRFFEGLILFSHREKKPIQRTITNSSFSSLSPLSLSVIVVFWFEWFMLIGAIFHCVFYFLCHIIWVARTRTHSHLSCVFKLIYLFLLWYCYFV